MRRLRDRLPRGVRWQATSAAAAVVAVALVAGGVALLLLLHTSLTSTVQSTLEAIVAEDARTLSDGGLTALVASERDRGNDGVLVQVLDSAGQVRYSSGPSTHTGSSALRPAPGVTEVAGRTVLPALPVPGRVAAPIEVATGVSAEGGPFVVSAQAPQESQEEAVETVATMLLVGIPVLTLVAALVTWWRVGRTLESVEAIRGRVEQIESAHVRQRVPVPATRDEIARLASTMNAMLERLEESDAAQRRFVADASHELRSPLATLTAALEVAGADASGTVWLELAPVVTAETDRMQRMVADLLWLSKVDSRALPARADDVDLDDVAAGECRRLLTPAEVDITLTSVPVRVVGDEHQLAQLLHNLIDNAARAATSRVEVGVERRDGSAVLTVSDDGPGIAVGDRELVFERFVRLDKSRSRGSGGSGLGLAIVREIAHAHGGSVVVGRSSLGGAQVVVTLPATSAVPASDSVQPA